MDDMMPIDLKFRHNPRRQNVAFKKALEDGIEYGTYPFETDLYNNMDMEIPINYNVHRIYDPMNPRRKIHPRQRRW